MAKSSKGSQVKAQPTEPKVTVQDEQPSTIENIISVILGLAVVLVIGAMIVNTIRNRQKDTTNPPTAAQTTTGEVTPEANTYTVKAGDSLWSIAVSSYNDGFKWTKIEQANSMNEDSHLEPGMKLIIPPLPTEISSPENATGSTGPTGGSTGPTGGLEAMEQTQPQQGQTLSTSTDKEYTVMKGDTLWNIAQTKLGNPYRWVEIAKLNNLANPNLIYSGNVFQLP